eukprot:6042238-Heterocapsa_arctica.AAC.1
MLSQSMPQARGATGRAILATSRYGFLCRPDTDGGGMRVHLLRRGTCRQSLARTPAGETWNYQRGG